MIYLSFGVQHLLPYQYFTLPKRSLQDRETIRELNS